MIRLLAFALLLSAVSVGRTAFAFRTTADLDEFGGVAARWGSSNIGFYFHADGAPGLSQVETQRRVAEGWFVWQQPMCSAVTISNSGVQHAPAGAGDGRNTIQWVTDWSARGLDPSAPGATDVHYESTQDGGWRIVEADIYLNAEHFVWTGPDAYDIASVIAHEMGHALGLLHPCEPSGEEGAPVCSDVPEAATATMFPRYNAEQATLSYSDEAGICFLYPGETCRDTGCPSGFVCTELGCEIECVPGCSLGEECMMGVCVGDRPRCPADAHCIEGKEDAGPGRFGDPCGVGGDCASGVCAESGSCSKGCTDDHECREGQSVCSDGLCVSSLRGLGEVCREADECLGGQCLRIDDRQPACTRLCYADADCSMGWTCQMFEDRSVCASRPPSSKGCSISGRGAPRGRGQGAFPWLGLLLSLFFCARRTVARHRRRRSGMGYGSGRFRTLA